MPMVSKASRNRVSASAMSLTFMSAVMFMVRLQEINWLECFHTKGNALRQLLRGILQKLPGVCSYFFTNVKKCT